RDAERSKALGDVRVLEPAVGLDGPEVRVEDIDRARIEVGGEEESAVGVEAHGEPLVDRAGGRVVNGDDGVGGVDAAVPSGARAVRGGEQFGGRAGRGPG